MLDTVKRPDRDLARYGARGAASIARKAHSFNNTRKIDFEAALSALPTLLGRWLPGGNRIGKEHIAINPTRADRRPGSFKVVIVGHRAGVSADFATSGPGFLAGACHLSAAISEALHRARAERARRSGRLRVLRAAA